MGDIEVNYRRLSSSDEAVEVFLDSSTQILPKKFCKDLKDLVGHSFGQYKRNEAAATPTWIKKPYLKTDLEATIEWNSHRRRWENIVGHTLVFYKVGDDEPGLPFGDGWQRAAACTSSTAEGAVTFPFIPKFTRSYEIMSQSFGPFKTGDPGEFVGVGELVTSANQGS